MEKNRIFPKGKVELGSVLAVELGCQLASLPSDYLGPSTGHKAQVLYYLGQGRSEILQENSHLEASIHYKGGQAHPNQEHLL